MADNNSILSAFIKDEYLKKQQAQQQPVNTTQPPVYATQEDDFSDFINEVNEMVKRNNQNPEDYSWGKNFVRSGETALVSPAAGWLASAGSATKTLSGQERDEQWADKYKEEKKQQDQQVDKDKALYDDTIGKGVNVSKTKDGFEQQTISDEDAQKLAEQGIASTLQMSLLKQRAKQAERIKTDPAMMKQIYEDKARYFGEESVNLILKAERLLESPDEKSVSEASRLLNKQRELQEEYLDNKHKAELIDRYGDLDTAYDNIMQIAADKSSTADRMITKAKQIKENLPDYDPNSVGGFMGSALGSVLPQLTAIIVGRFAPPVGQAMAYSSIAYLTGGSGGNAVQDYQDHFENAQFAYEKEAETLKAIINNKELPASDRSEAAIKLQDLEANKPVYEKTEAFRQFALNAYAEFWFEKLNFETWMPKSPLVKKTGKELVEKFSGEAFWDLLNEMSKKTGNKIWGKAKKLLGISAFEGLEELGTQPVQMFAQDLYKLDSEKSTWQDYVYKSLYAGAAGFFAGTFMGGANVSTESYTQRKNRQNQGGLFLAENKNPETKDKAPVIEILGASGENKSVVAYTPDGRQIVVAKEDIGHTEFIPLDDWNKFVTTKQKSEVEAAKLAKEFEAQAQARKSQQQFAFIADNISHQDGSIIGVALNEDGTDVAYVKQGEYTVDAEGNLRFKDPSQPLMAVKADGSKVIISPKDIWGSYQTTKEEFISSNVAYQQQQTNPTKPDVATSPETTALLEKLEAGMEVKTDQGTYVISNIQGVEDGSIIVNIYTEDGKEQQIEMPVEEALDLFAPAIQKNESPVVDNAEQPQQEAGNKPVSTPAGEISTPAQSVSTPATDQPQAPQVPMTKDGNVDFDNIQEPELFAAGLQQEFGEDAADVFAGLMQEAQANLKAADKKKNAIEKARARKKAQAEIDKLTKVQSILNPQQVETQSNEQDPQDQGAVSIGEVQPELPGTPQEPAQAQSQQAEAQPVQDETAPDQGGVDGSETPSEEWIKQTQGNVNQAISELPIKPIEHVINNTIKEFDKRVADGANPVDVLNILKENLKIEETGADWENGTVKENAQRKQNITNLKEAIARIESRQPQSPSTPTADQITFNAPDGETKTGKVIEKFETGSMRVETTEGEVWTVKPDMIVGNQQQPADEIIPHDGWRGNLIKSRAYARQLFTIEELDKLRNEDAFDWTDAKSIERLIDERLDESKPTYNGMSVNDTLDELLDNKKLRPSSMRSMAGFITKNIDHLNNNRKYLFNKWVEEHKSSIQIDKPTIKEIADASEGRINIVKPATQPKEVDVEKLFGSLKETGEAKLSDNLKQEKEYGANNKIVSKSRYEELKAQMKDKLNNLNAGFDPEMLAIGTEMAAYHIEAGARKFADFVKAMTNDIGNNIKPYLKSIYNGARDIPGMEELESEMTPYDEVRKADIDNLLNTQQDGTEPESTESIETQTEAIEREAENVRDAEAAADLDAKIDKVLTQIDLQLKQDAYSTEDINHEYPNIEVAKRIKKDVAKFSKELANTLGWEHDTRKKGKKEIPEYADANIPPAGGDATFILWMPGTDLGVYVSIPYQSDWGSDGYENYQIQKKDAALDMFGGTILWRLTTKKNKYSGMGNRFAPANVTVGQLAGMIEQAVKSERLTNQGNNHNFTPNNQTDEQGTKTTRKSIGSNEVGMDEGQPAKTDDGNVSQGDTTTESVTGSGTSKQNISETDGTRDAEDGSTGNETTYTGSGRRDGEPSGQTSDIEQNVRQYKKRSNAIAPEDQNHVISPDDVIVPRGDTAKVRANIAAIKLVKNLDEKKKNPTPSEKKTLAKYVGWGGLAPVFENKWYDSNWKNKWGDFYTELKGLLTDKEWQAAKESTVNAHYTDRNVISSLWSIAERLGFKGGTVLEPAGGIGHFFGLMPETLQDNSRLLGFELDKISGMIFSKLYPQAKVNIAGYETANLPNNSLDLVISNVPFGQIKVFDKDNKDIAEFLIHNYFMAKGARKLKPGGLGIYITTAASMDNEGGGRQFRTWMSSSEGGNSDLIGAIRLPNNAFKENAGTEVTTDVLIFRKRKNDTPSKFANNFINVETIGEAKTKEGEKVPLRINEYFAKNPDQLIGKVMLAHEAGSGGLYSGNSQTLAPLKGVNLQEKIEELISKMPENVMDADDTEVQFIEDVNQKHGSIHVVNGKPVVVSMGEYIELGWNDNKVMGKYTKAQVVTDYNKLKDAVRNIVTLETTEEATDAEIETARKELNKVYDAFTKKYGELYNNRKINFLQDDVESSLVYMLENIKEVTKKDKQGLPYVEFSVEKSDIFFKRVNLPRTEPKTASSLEDAINISLAYRNKLDESYVAQLLDTTKENAVAELIENGYAFINPETGIVEDRATYLSGNVRQKLEKAKQEAEKDPQYKPNVEELEKVIPEDVPYFQINMQLGAPWIPPQVVEEWIKKTIDVDVKLTYNKALNKWGTVGWIRNEYNSKNRTEFAGGGIDAIKLIIDALNTTAPVVYDRFNEGGKTRQQKNVAKTTEAQSAQTNLKMMFRSFAAELSEKNRDALQRIYNEKFNSYVEKKWAQPKLKHFPGAAKHIELRPHQKIGVLKSLSQPTLLAHQVGTGKTFTLITTAMEMRRIGTARKPMIIVQKATLNQFINSFIELYPAAKLLVPSAKDITKKERQNFFAKVALNDWDAIVIHHDALSRMPDNPDRVADYLQERIDELQETLAEMENGDALKNQIEKEIEALQDKIEDSRENARKAKDEAKQALNTRTRLSKQADRATDDIIFFEQLGVDALLVDEAHTYKRLGFSTKAGNVKGIDTSGSQKAMSAMLKIRHILENNNGKNVVFATGTPISNTMAEIWTMMKFLIPNRLTEYGVSNFDEFKTTFGEVVPSIEFTAAGQFKSVDRFSKYINLPELKKLFRSTADIVLTENIESLKSGVGTPKLFEDKITNVELSMTPALENMMEGFKRTLKAWEKLPGKEKRQQSHIPLTIFNLAKRAAIDVRLVDSSIKDDPGSKITAVVNNTVKFNKQSDSYKGTQLIFVDARKSADDKFILADEIKRQLIANGIKADEVQSIYDHDTDSRREKLFDKMNNGEVRILIGGTEKLGIGVNVQKRLFVVHHVDAPQRPMDFEQRNGRILRQGNTHLDMDIPVHVITYGVAKTLDATAYQRLSIKHKFIQQALSDDMSERSINDDDDVAGMSYDQMMANLSGSQYAIIHTKKTYDLKSLKVEQSLFKNRQIAAFKSINEKNQLIPRMEQFQKDAADVIKQIEKSKIQDGIKKVQLGNKTFIETKKESIAKQIQDYIDPIIEPILLSNEVSEQQFKLVLNDTFGVILKIKNASRAGEYHVSYTVDQSYNYHATLNHGYNTVNVSVSGIFSSMKSTYMPDKIQDVIDKSIANMKQYEKDIVDLNDLIKQKFPKEKEVEQLEKEVEDLERLMVEETKEAEKTISDDGDINDIEKFRNDDAKDDDDEDTGEPDTPRLSASTPSLPDILMINGKERPTQNSNGQPIAATEEGVRNFWNWFGDSKVVDEQGRPLVVYHGAPDARFVNEDGTFKNHNQRWGRDEMTLKPMYEEFAKLLPESDKSYFVSRMLKFDSDKNKNKKTNPFESYRRLAGEVESRNAQARMKLTPEQRRKMLLIETEDVARDDQIFLKNVLSGNIESQLTTPEAKRKVIEQLNKQSTSVNRSIIVNKQSELPLEIRQRVRSDIKARGMLYGGATYYVLENINNAGDAVRVWMHEQGVHYGLLRLIPNPEERQAFLERVFDEIGIDAIGKVVDFNTYDKKMPKHLLAEEYMSHLVDKKLTGRALSISQQSIWKQFIHYINKFIQKIIGNKNVRITEADVLEVAKAAIHTNLKGNERQEIAKNPYTRARHTSAALQRSGVNAYRTQRPSAAQQAQNTQQDDILFSKVATKKETPTQDLFNLERSPDKALAFSLQNAELFWDAHKRWEVLRDQILARGGRVPEWADPYQHVTLLSSINQHEIENYDKQLWEPLMKTISKISKKSNLELEQIEKYMMFKHAPERNRVIRERNPKATGDEVYAGSIDRVPLTDEYATEQAKRYEQLIGQELVDEFWQNVNAATDFSLRKHRDSGFMLDEDYRRISEQYDNYVPLRGFADTTPEQLFDYLEDSNSSDGFQNPVKKAKGRTSEADSPLVHIHAMAETAVMYGNKNKLKQKALAMARLNRDDMRDLFDMRQVWMVDTGEVDKNNDPIMREAVWEGENVYYIDDFDEKTGALIKIFAGKADELKAEGRISYQQNFKHYRRNTTQRAEQHHIVVHEAGRKYIVVMTDPQLARSINGKTMAKIPQTGIEIADKAMHLPSKAVRQLSMLRTSKNPAFIPVNFIRDIGYASMAHGIKESGDFKMFMGNISKATAAIHRYERGTADPKNNAEDAMFERFLKAGGRTGYAHTNDIEGYRRMTKRQIERLTGKNGKLDKLAYNNATKFVNSSIDYLAALSEDTARFATFMVSKSKGRSDSMAALDAKNITVNFNQKGRVAPLLGSLYAFANAAIQGGVNITRMAKSHPKAFAKAGGFFVALGYIMAEAMRFALPDDDKEELYSISRYIRDNYMVIPNPMWIWGQSKDKYISIPLPHGFRAFYSVGQVASDMIHGAEEPLSGIARIADNVTATFSPWDIASFINKDKEFSARPFVPTWYMPIFDITNNEDFAGRKVFNEMFTPTLEDRVPDSQKGLKTTNPWLTEMTQTLNRWAGGDDTRPAKYVFNEKTGRFEVNGLRNAFDINPAKVEHLIEGYTGGAGVFINQSIKTLTNAVMIATGSEDAEIDTKDVPVLNMLYRTSYKSQDVSDYYDMMRSTSAYKYFKNKDKEGFATDARVEQDLKFITKLKKQVKKYDDRIEKQTDERLRRKLVEEKNEFISEQMRNYKKTE